MKTDKQSLTLPNRYIGGILYSLVLFIVLYIPQIASATTCDSEVTYQNNCSFYECLDINSSTPFRIRGDELPVNGIITGTAPRDGYYLVQYVSETGFEMIGYWGCLVCGEGCCQLIRYYVGECALPPELPTCTNPETSLTWEYQGTISDSTSSCSQSLTFTYAIYWYCANQYGVGTEEICDGYDNDCDGDIDEDVCNDCKLEEPAGSTVNMANGRLRHSQSLFSVGNAALPVNFTLTYNYHGRKGPLGYGWVHSYELTLKQNRDGSYNFRKDNGRAISLIQNGTEYKPLRAEYPVMTVNPDGTYTLVTKGNETYQFNQDGRVMSISDRNNNSILFRYDTNNNLTTITDTAGRVISLTYTTDDKISTITDTNGNVHTFTYTGGNLDGVSKQTVDAGILNWSYTYDAPGNMLTKTDPMGHTTTYVYDDNNRLIETHDPEDNIRTMTYDTSLKTSEIVQRDGGLWTYKYDEVLGVLLEKTDPEGNRWVYTYDSNGKMLTKTDPLNYKTTYSYDANGNVTTITDHLNNTTVYTYNADNQVLTITDPENNVTTYTYYSNGNLETETDPTGAITMYQYDSAGNMTQITNPLNQIKTLIYDTSNNLTSVTDFNGGTTSFTYDVNGNMLTRTDPRNNTTTYTYDSLNRLKTKIDPLNNVTTYTYDFNGNMTSMTDANGNTTTYEYNYKSQLAKVTDPLLNVTTYTYGGTGCSSCGGGGDNLIAVTNANGRTTSYQYDFLGRKTIKTDPLANRIDYYYDPLGRMTALTDPESSTTQFGYDARGLQVTRTDPLGFQTTYTYEDAGRLTSRTNRNNDIISYSYKADGKVDTITYPDLSTVAFSYDIIDRVTQMQDSLGITTYVYDDVNHTVTVTDPHGFVVVHTYDVAGNLTGLTYPGNKTVTYTYDELNRLKTVTNWLSQTATYYYDPAGRLDYIENFNGTITNYGYDIANRLTSIDHTRTDLSTIASYSFVLDAIGNRIQVAKNEPLVPAYSSDMTVYTFNPERNRLLTAGVTNFTYDNEGQVQSKDVDTYAFDYEHRLATMAGSINALFSYDGKGNRLQAERNGVITRYIYDTGGNLLAEADATNTITRYYIHGSGLLAMVTPSGDTYTYHHNAIGSTVAITDQNQNIVNSYAYTPFGELTESETISQPFKYVGQYGVMHEPNGFYYMRARYYDPEVGRFVSEDPIGFAGGTVNLYGYAKSNPVIYIDANGLWSYKATCRYFSGGAIVGAGSFRCKVRTFCRTDKTREIGEISISFYGFTVGFPLPVGETWSNIELERRPFSRYPKLSDLEGSASIKSIGGAFFDFYGWGYMKLTMGMAYGEITGNQTGLDLSADIMWGTSSLSQCETECCNNIWE